MGKDTQSETQLPSTGAPTEIPANKEETSSEYAAVRKFEPGNEADMQAALALDLESPAENPYAVSEEDKKRKMTPEELRRWIGEGDTNHYTRAMYLRKDPTQTPRGYAYVYRNDKDTIQREPFVEKLARDAKLPIDQDGLFFELNFDAPQQGEYYVDFCISGLKQTLSEFFVAVNYKEGDPEALKARYIVVHVEDDSLEADGYILKQLGAMNIGKLSYEDPGKIEEEKNDTVFLITKESFEKACLPEELQKLKESPTIPSAPPSPSAEPPIPPPAPTA